MFHALAVLAAEEKTLWDPTILGLLTVVSAVVLFCGSTYLLLATNVGGRLGFMISVAALSGILVLLSSLWLITQTPLNSPKGRTPLWLTAPCPKENGVETQCAVVDRLRDALPGAVNAIGRNPSILPLTEDKFQQLRPAVEAALVQRKAVGEAPVAKQPYAKYSETSEVLTKVHDRNADAAAAAETKAAELREKAATKSGAEKAKLLAQAKELEAKIPGYLAASAADTKVLHEFIIGGETKWLFWHKPKYAAVEFCQAAQTPDDPNFAPPKTGLPCDPNVPHRWLILRHDYGSIRLPPLMYLLTSLAIFLVSLYALHSRELAQRRIAAAAASTPVPA